MITHISRLEPVGEKQTKSIEIHYNSKLELPQWVVVEREGPSCSILSGFS